MGHIRSKHDKFFKRMMKNIQLARDFFETHLPEKILSLVDLSTIKLEDSSFVDGDLYGHESDVLFSVKIKETGEECFLYTLCEHQSRPDPEMPFRLIYYIMQFLKRYLIEHRPSPFPLPLVYPLVVYNGTVPWNTYRDFFSAFGKLLECAHSIFLDPFAILDVTQMAEDDLRHARLSNLMLASLIRTKNIQDIERKIKLLNELFQSCGIDLHSGTLRTVLKYLSSCIDPRRQDIQSYWLTIRQSFSPKYQGAVMDLLEATKQMMREEMRDEVHQEVRQEVRQEVFQETMKKTAIQMLKEGITLALVAKITGFSLQTVQDLAILATEV